MTHSAYCYMSMYVLEFFANSYLISTSLSAVVGDILFYSLATCMSVSVYRTAAFLMKHLARMSVHDAKTGMHCKNLAIVWAPNLLKFVLISCLFCNSSLFCLLFEPVFTF